MKKILAILIFTTICLTTFGQKRAATLLIPDSTTIFNVPLPANSLVFDYAANRLWKLTAFADATTDLQNASKELITQSGAGEQTLAEVLAEGNSAGANDILLGTNAAKFGGSNNMEISDVGGTFQFLNNDISGFATIEQKINSGVINNTNIFSAGQHVWEQTGGGTKGRFIIDYAVDQVPFLTFKDIGGGGTIGYKLDLKTAFPFSSDRVITLPNLTGTVGLTSQFLENTDLTLAAERTITQDGNDFIFSGINSASVGIGGTPESTNKLDIQITAGSTTPLAFFEGTVGVPVSAGQNFAIDFDMTDINGDRTTGQRITARNDGVATAGIVPMSLNIGNDFKAQSNGRFLIAPSSLSLGAVAQFEIRGLSGTSTNTTLLITAAGNTGGQLPLWIKNAAGNSLLQLNGLGQYTHNVNAINSADFKVIGDLTPALVVDAGEDAIVVGGTNPDNTAVLDIRSTTKGVLMPRLTTAERDGIVSPATGLIIYNTIINTLQYYNGSIWTNS